MTEKIQTGHVMHSSHIRKDKSQIVINIITYILVTIFCIMCIMPFWMIVASSFATEDSVRRSVSPSGPRRFPPIPMSCSSAVRIR